MIEHVAMPGKVWPEAPLAAPAAEGRRHGSPGSAEIPRPERYSRKGMATSSASAPSCRHPPGLIPILALTLLAAALDPAAAVDRLVVDMPLVAPPEAEGGGRVLALVEKAVVLANRLYGPRIEVVPPGTAVPGGYRVAIVAALGEDPVLAVSMKPPAQEPPAQVSTSRGSGTMSFALMGPPGAETVHYLARVLFLLWASDQDSLSRPRGEPPRLLDELPVDALADSLLPGVGAALVPLSVAVSGQGTVLVGLSALAVELDRAFRILGQPGRSLLEEGAGGFAQSLTVTPEGTTYLKASMGGVIYRVAAAAPQEAPGTIRLTGNPYGPLAALPDGSVALLDTMGRRLWRIEGERLREVPLAVGPHAWPTAMAAGPEGTLWIYYPVERRIRVYAPGGELLDSVLPLMDYYRPIEAAAMAVYPDGRFLFYGRQGLWCFDRSGLPLWHLEELPALYPGGSAENLPQPATLAVDPQVGLIYLADSTGRRILQLLDLQYCRDVGIEPGRELRLLELNETQRLSPGDAEATAAKAQLYEQAGALEMARVQWARALEIDPGNPQAQGRQAAVEHELARSAAATARGRAIRALEQIGTESARPAYQEAMRLYERLLARFPRDADARAEMAELRERFETSGGLPGSPRSTPALVLEHVEAENLFPALMQVYHRRPVIRLEVRNTSDRPVGDLRAEILVERFMDFVSQSESVAALAPGARATLELKVPLNARVLELEEDLPVQGRVEVFYRQGPVEAVVRTSVGFTIHRRTALRWDDSGKLGSFVTPHEGVVSSFALRVSHAGEEPPLRLSKRLLRAMRICDALGAYGIRYVEDPDSPISRILGRPEVVDTVRFPRQTLQLRSGDCDDTTALLASLLEAAGIRTAILTTPGHVFLAFDSGESSSSAWILEDPERAVVLRDGTAWLPVETTVLSRGFMSAWGEGSRLYRRYAPGGQVEFLPLRELRERYPPIALPASRLPVVEPTEVEIAALNGATLRDLQERLYGQRLGALRRELGEAGRGSGAARLSNRIGILHAVFGYDREAAASFRSLLSERPEYQPASLNLATLLISRGELDAAEEVLRQALVRDRESPAANLLLAQLYERRGDRLNAREHFRVVERRDPEMAARFAYLSEETQTPRDQALGGVPPGRQPPGSGEGTRAVTAAPPIRFWE